MAIVSGCELGCALAKALGLEEVTKLTIHVEAEGPAKVVVERLVSRAEAGTLATIVEEYRLVKREDVEG